MERGNFSAAAGFGMSSLGNRQGIFSTFAAFLEMCTSEFTMARLNRESTEKWVTGPHRQLLQKADSDLHICSLRYNHTIARLTRFSQPRGLILSRFPSFSLHSRAPRACFVQ